MAEHGSPTHKQDAGVAKTPSNADSAKGEIPVPDFRGEGELTPAQIMRLQSTIGNHAVQRLLGRSERKIQRVFQPATLNSKTHLRPLTGTGDVDVKHKVGRNIPSGAEVIIDTADQKVQHRHIIKNVTWTRAVDKTGAQWNPLADPAGTWYMRNAKATPKVYPKQETLTLASRGTLDVERKWDVAVGEYVDIEPSIADPTKRIIKIPAGYRSMTAGHVLAGLTALENTQIDDISREAAARSRLNIILTNAATANGINPALMATANNIQGLMRDDAPGNMEKSPLRYLMGTGSQKDKNRWYEWVQAVFAKIAQGADELAQSIVHWKSTIYPPNAGLVGITEIKLEGSDLHDKGLGAVFVTYTKPNDGNGMFPNVPSVKVVIKPENRNVEKAMFGTQGGSLANVINQHANLGVADAITTFKMETHANYGSIIEFVQGQQARAINRTGADTQAMSEGIAFAFLTGMSDVHQDNVIWNNGKPYFIDADNSLNADRLQTLSGQSGFSMNNPARTNTDIGDINNNPGGARSLIIQSIMQHNTPFIQAITNALTGKTGRIVPLYTNYWGNKFKTAYGYMLKDLGTPGDQLANVVTKWSIANDAAAKVVAGGQGIGGGFVKECGTALAGGAFNQVLEAQQIKADLDQGKIPFYEYEYTTGHIKHNGQVIWHGQTLAQAMAVLQLKFPHP